MKFKNHFENAKRAIRKGVISTGIVAATALTSHAKSLESPAIALADQNKALISYILENKTGMIWHDVENHQYYKVTEYHGPGSTGIAVEITPDNSSGTISYIDTNNDGVPDQLLSQGGVMDLQNASPELVAKAADRFQKALAKIKELIQKPE